MQQDTDRDRIARELHDVVIQRLFATGLHLQKSRTMVTDPDVEERLALSMQDLDQTIRAIRSSIFDLQGGPRSSVRSDLRDIVGEFVDQLGFTPTVHTHGQVDSSLTGGKQQAFGDVPDVYIASAGVFEPVRRIAIICEVQD